MLRRLLSCILIAVMSSIFLILLCVLGELILLHPMYFLTAVVVLALTHLTGALLIDCIVHTFDKKTSNKKA